VAPVVDVHVHLSETAELGAWSKAAYEIWEYGVKDDVRFSDATGVLADLVARMRDGGIDHAVVVNATSVDELRGRWLDGVDVVWEGTAVVPAVGDAEASLGERLITFNRWLVSSVADVDGITPFVAADPWMLGTTELIAHLTDMAALGARGVKLHPPDQRCFPGDPRLLRVWRACVELDLTVLSHSGSTRGPRRFADPEVFGDVLKEVPNLRLVVAHLGGGEWTRVPALADAFPQVLFDVSEIVAWLGAPRGPDAVSLVRTLREIGVERVMFGSDYPWYDPGDMAEVVAGLPGLSAGEVSAILGENAVRLLSLPV
jgi:predicted TIM-barrel fold metal-dependent hydrolase